MEDLKQKTLVLKRDKPRFIDELRNGPVKQKIDFKYAIDKYSEAYLDAIKDACLEHRQDRRITGYLEGKITYNEWAVPQYGGFHFIDKLPCADPQEIKRSETKQRTDFGGCKYYVYKLMPKSVYMHPDTAYPYADIALEYQDSEFVNGLVDELKRRLYDEGFTNFSITPVTLDNVKITATYKKGIFGKKIGKPALNTMQYTPLNFHATKEGKITTLKYDIRW